MNELDFRAKMISVKPIIPSCDLLILSNQFYDEINKKQESKVLGTVISVDCIDNTPERIKKGGPKKLGFDFTVRKESANEMMGHIKDMLDAFELPIEAIYYSGESYVNPNWINSLEEIFEMICDESGNILAEFDKKINPEEKTFY